MENKQIHYGTQPYQFSSRFEFSQYQVDIDKFLAIHNLNIARNLSDIVLGSSSSMVSR